MGDAAVPVGAQKRHLVFLSVRVERPPVAEDNGLPAAPVLVIYPRSHTSIVNRGFMPVVRGVSALPVLVSLSFP